MENAYAGSLYDGWGGEAVELPAWFCRFGLSRYKPVISRAYASAKKWQQAELDGIGHVAPIIICFNQNPREIKKLIGAEHWRMIREGSLKANIDRMVLRLIGGWTFDEAMQIPPKMKRHAKTLLEGSKSSVLTACRLTTGIDADFKAQLIIATDSIRMGVQLDPEWGRKRLKREHDAAAMKMMLQNSDPTPWAKAWFHDVGSYSFTLLKSETELAIEGATQRHCCKSYAKACRVGKEVVLRIEGPERATCAWRGSESAIQVKGFANTGVTKECVMAARAARASYGEWLRRATAEAMG